jgi:hypothetical protein
MVTCNICRQNKKLDEMQGNFRYVCKECWAKMKVKIQEQEINKDLIY